NFIIAYFFLIILLAGSPLIALADNSEQDSLADFHWRTGQKALDAGDHVNALRSFRQSLQLILILQKRTFRWLLLAWLRETIPLLQFILKFALNSNQVMS
ncbi:MAG: hypothetical protein EBQ87_07055, partial [Planctomycetes bacterium]|nr:hypothetical protein [Planctomycetota bacterium]